MSNMNVYMGLSIHLARVMYLTVMYLVPTALTKFLYNITEQETETSLKKSLHGARAFLVTVMLLIELTGPQEH